MNPSFVLPVVNKLELHLSGSSLFTSRSWARKVKDLGGTYSECRGDDATGTRFVNVPNTAPGRRLAADLLAEFYRGGTGAMTRNGVVIFRDIEGTYSSHAHVVVSVKRMKVGEEWQGDGALPGQADDILDQLTRQLRRFEEAALAWWESKGRAAAERDQSDREQRARDAAARSLVDVASAARHALDCGHSPAAVRQAVEAVLFRAASHAQLSRSAS